MDWRSWCPTAHWFLPSITTTITRSQSVVNCVMGACVFKHHRLMCLCEALSNCPALHLKTSSLDFEHPFWPNNFSFCWFFSNWYVLFWSRTRISSSITLFHFLHSCNRVPLLRSLDHSQWSQVLFQNIQCLFISRPCDKHASLALRLSLRLGYFCDLWTHHQHSLPLDQKTFSSSTSLSLFSTLIFSLCSRVCCSRLAKLLPQSINLSCFSVSFKKTWRTTFVKDIFLLIECNDVHEIHQSAISLAFQMTIKASMWMKKQCLLIITGCGNHNLNLFFARNMLFLFPEQKRAQEQTQIYVVRFSWQQFQKQKKWVKNWEYHFSDLCCMLLDVVGTK